MTHCDFCFRKKNWLIRAQTTRFMSQKLDICTKAKLQCKMSICEKNTERLSCGTLFKKKKTVNI